MNDYSRYSHYFRTHEWTHVPVRDEWLDERCVLFEVRPYFRHDIKEWLEQTPAGSYALLEDEDHFVNHVIAFSQPKGASWFLLRWS